MVNKKYFKSKPISIPLQKLNIIRDYKEVIVKINKKRGINIDISLQPTEFSPIYTLKVVYKSLNKHPKVFLLESELKTRDNEKIPHNYGYKNINGYRYLELCLYYPGEWNSRMLISDTIIPWASEWLYFYEIWLLSGVWTGGGIHNNRM